MSQNCGKTLLTLSEASEKLCLLAKSSPVQRIADALGDKSRLHIVGGSVRETLLGKTHGDLDLACRVKPDQVLDRLNKAGIHCVPTGIEHGTVIAVIDGTNVEITTFRAPGSRYVGKQRYSNDILTDLQGRDFTINAIAYSIADNKIIDPLSGYDDLTKGVVKAVMSPRERFHEDPLRMMRMVRFGPVENRKIDDATYDTAKAYYNLIEKVSWERIRDEFIKIILSDYPAEGLEALKDLKILNIILPEIVPSYGFEQNEYHLYDVFEHTLKVIENTPQNLTQRITALFHDIGKPYTLSVGEDGRRHFYKHEIVGTDLAKKAMKRLKFPNKQIKDVTTLVRHHMRPIECGPAGLRRLYRDLGELFDTWLEFKRADALGAKMDEEEFNKRLRTFYELIDEEERRRQEENYLKLAVNGHDLIELGYKEGKKLGKALKKLEEAVLDDPSLNERETLLSLAKEYLLSSEFNNGV
ncbi:MAG: HD domain-containing protein [Candidatus Dadabacteria bacterium]|nr:MAG: HD domain-containing protein [Candidatus Dadabacteria bacterium]